MAQAALSPSVSRAASLEEKCTVMESLMRDRGMESEVQKQELGAQLPRLSLGPPFVPRCSETYTI